MVAACSISPPTWRWPEGERWEIYAEMDFPTHVGMARDNNPPRYRAARFPHPRGDGPVEDAT